MTLNTSHFLDGGTPPSADDNRAVNLILQAAAAFPLTGLTVYWNGTGARVIHVFELDYRLRDRDLNPFRAASMEIRPWVP